MSVYVSDSHFTELAAAILTSVADLTTAKQRPDSEMLHLRDKNDEMSKHAAEHWAVGLLAVCSSM